MTSCAEAHEQGTDAGGTPTLGPFEVTEEPLSVDDLVAQVATPADGAVVTFVGLVRDNQDGRGVTALEYEAYAEMAESLARMACVRGQSSSRRLPAARDQGLGTWICNEPISRRRGPRS